MTKSTHFSVHIKSTHFWFDKKYSQNETWVLFVIPAENQSNKYSFSWVLFVITEPMALYTLSIMLRYDSVMLQSHQLDYIELWIGIDSSCYRESASFVSEVNTMVQESLLIPCIVCDFMATAGEIDHLAVSKIIGQIISTQMVRLKRFYTTRNVGSQSNFSLP